MKLLVLIGSPRSRSTSGMLGQELAHRIDPTGQTVETLQLSRCLRHDSTAKALIEAVEATDLILLSSPLYVDSLPAAVIGGLERLHDHFKRCPPVGKQLMALINCGFPEPGHNRLAVAMCRLFCLQTGLRWMGGLGVGGGEALAGKPLEERTWFSRPVIKALDLTAAALLTGQSVPAEAQAMIQRPFMPIWLYTTAGSLGWRMKALRHRRLRLNAQPWRQ